jgi:hypothetical protein
MFLIIFKDGVSTAEFIQPQMGWKYEHDSPVGKNLQGSGHGLFEGNICAQERSKIPIG